MTSPGVPPLACAKRRFLPLIAALLLLSGCSVWDSVTSYFNTYYNAARLFDEAEEELWSQPDTRFSGRDVLASFVLGQGPRTKLTSVIEKCSKLLQYHPESKLVDDALLMIGRSYLYQAEYQRAVRKFTELIDQYPESDLVLEARFLLAAAYWRMGDTETARRTAEAVLQTAREDERETMVGDVSNLLARIELEERNLTAARESFLVAAENAGHPDRRASASLVVASLDSAAGDYAGAEAAYRRARQEGTSYVYEYRGRIGEARMAVRQGEFEDALDELDDLRSNTNFREFFGEIDLETGFVYLNQGSLGTAMESFRYVDTAYARTEVAAKAVYQLGQIYEIRLVEYDSAQALYNRGRNIAPAAPVSKEIVRRADYLNRYFVLHTEIAKYDSMLTQLSSAPPETRGERRLSGSRAADSVRTDSSGAIQLPAGERSVSTGDSTGAEQVVRSEGTDSLGHAVPDSMMSAVAPGDVAGIVPDSSRIRSVSDSLALAARDTTRGGGTVPGSGAVSLPRDTIESRLSYAMNELATMFFTTMNRPDSAARWYDFLLARFPDSRVAPRALYGYAQVLARDSTIRPEVSDSLYRKLVMRYPDTEFAAEARRVLGLPPAVRAASMAEELYRAAEKELLEGSPRKAVNLFRSIPRDYPESPFASRAQFAAGFVYGEQLGNRDSAVASYRRLADNYPDSPFAGRIKPLLTEIDRAAAAAKAPATDTTAAAKDSVSAATDSLGVSPAPEPGPPGEQPSLERESARRRRAGNPPSRLPEDEEPSQQGHVPPRPE